jgi:hypothetical protein
MRRLETLPSLPRRTPVVLLWVFAAASIVLLLVLCSGMTFFQDEWNMTIHRRAFDAESFFAANDIHPVWLIVAIYKLSLALFGMTSVGPVRVLAVLLYAGTAILLFFYVRRRLGDWLALFPAVILMFLGPGWNVLLWPFEMTLVGSAAAGLGALLLLDRDDRAGDVGACALLVLAMGCSSLGVPFALAAGVDVLLRHRTRGWSRIYVAALPLAVYALWYLTWGHKVPNALSLANMLDTPVFVAESIASALGSLTGLHTAAVGSEAATPPEWGRALLVAVAALVALWVRRARDISPRIWVPLTAAGAYWILGGFNFIPGRDPTASRYQYIGGIFVVLILAEVFRGARVSNRTLAILAAVTGVILISNGSPLKEGRALMKQQSDLARGELAAIEIARDTVSPEFALTPEIAGTSTLVPIDAGSYLTAVDDFGSPAESPAELASATEGVRERVDVVLAQALPLTTIPQSDATGGSGRAPTAAAPIEGARTQGSCLLIPAGGAAGGAPLVLSGSTLIRVGTGAPATLALRRYAEDFALKGGSLGAGATTLLSFPRDHSDVPWQIELSAAQSISVCSYPGRSAADSDSVPRSP